METIPTAFLAEATRWADTHPDIVALALIGSHARGAARPDSDIDLTVLCQRPSRLLEDSGWASRFGTVRNRAVEDYGPTQSLRVHYDDGMEVEFGIAEPAWAALPLDPGTLSVLSGGVRILYDPSRILGDACAIALAR